MSRKPSTPVLNTALSHSGKLFGSWEYTNSIGGTLPSSTLPSDLGSMRPAFIDSSAVYIALDNPDNRGVQTNHSSFTEDQPYGGTACHGCSWRGYWRNPTVAQTNGSIILWLASGMVVVDDTTPSGLALWVDPYISIEWTSLELPVLEDGKLYEFFCQTDYATQTQTFAVNGRILGTNTFPSASNPAASLGNIPVVLETGHWSSIAERPTTSRFRAFTSPLTADEIRYEFEYPSGLIGAETFPADRERKVQVTLDTSAAGGFVTGTADRVLVPITEEHLPEGMLAVGGADSAQLDGADIAVTLDELGTQRIPLWLRRWTQGAPGASSALLCVALDLDVDVPASVWVWWRTNYTEDIHGVQAAFQVNELVGLDEPNRLGATMFIPLDEDPGGTAPQFKDISGNGRNFTTPGGTVESLPGIGPRGVPAYRSVTGTLGSVPGLEASDPFTFLLWGVPSLQDASGSTIQFEWRTGPTAFRQAVELGLASATNANVTVRLDNAAFVTANGFPESLFGQPAYVSGPQMVSLRHDGSGVYSLVADGGQLGSRNLTPQALPEGAATISGNWNGVLSTPVSDVLMFVGEEKTLTWLEVYESLWTPSSISGWASPGSILLTQVSRLLTLAGCPLNTEARIYLLDAIGGNIISEIDGIESTAEENPQLEYTVVTTIPVRVVLFNLGFIPVMFDTVLGTTAVTLPASALLNIDRVYSNPS